MQRACLLGGLLGMLAVVLITGCSFGLGGSADTTTSSVDTEDTRIDAVSPEAGPTHGGTKVTVTGAGFVGTVKVYFGGVEGNVTASDSGSITVKSPASDGTGAVDLHVETDNGKDTLAAAFTYNGGSSSGDDTAAPGGGGGGDDTGARDRSAPASDPYAGLVGGYLDFGYTDVACPSCLSVRDGDAVSVRATAAFRTPGAASLLDRLPAEGTCVTDIAPAPAVASLDAGSAVTLTDASGTVALAAFPGAGGVSYAASGLVASDFDPDTVYDLAVPDGGEVPAFHIAEALRTPRAFTAITPAALLATTPSGAFTVGFGGAGTAVGWAPSGGSDMVLVTLRAREGSAFAGTTTCRAADTGAFTVPGSAVAAWPVGTHLSVGVARVSVAQVLATDGGGYLEAMTSYEQVGTGIVGN